MKTTAAETLTNGCQVCEADGFLLEVVGAKLQGRSVVLTLRPVFGSMTWAAGETRTVKVGRGRPVRVP